MLSGANVPPGKHDCLRSFCKNRILKIDFENLPTGDSMSSEKLAKKMDWKNIPATLLARLNIHV